MAKRRNAAEREQESETKHMQDLFAAGLIEAGEGVISFGNDSLTTTADLRGDGFITCKIGGKCRAFKSPSNFVFAVREELHPGAFNLVNPGVEQLMYKRTLLKDLGIKLEKCGQPNLEGDDAVIQLSSDGDLESEEDFSFGLLPRPEKGEETDGRGVCLQEWSGHR